jgi:hypothetical protein
MGDMPGQSLDALLVAACNRLAKRTEGGAALAFEALDAAADVEGRLTQAESVLGQVGLPEGVGYEAVAS